MVRSDYMAEIVEDTWVDMETENLVGCAFCCREYCTEYFRSILLECFCSDLQRPALACSTTARPRSAGRLRRFGVTSYISLFTYTRVRQQEVRRVMLRVSLTD